MQNIPRGDHTFVDIMGNSSGGSLGGGEMSFEEAS